MSIRFILVVGLFLVSCCSFVFAVDRDRGVLSIARYLNARRYRKPVHLPRFSSVIEVLDLPEVLLVKECVKYAVCGKLVFEKKHGNWVKVSDSDVFSRVLRSLT
jgi:hypothetical protein